MLTSLEYHPRCATAIWYRTQMIWPPENDDDKHMMDSLRAMLDKLAGDVIADRPEDWDKVDGDGLVGENEESSVEDAQGDVHENVETEDR
jgi:hypothetical protein